MQFMTVQPGEAVINGELDREQAILHEAEYIAPLDGPERYDEAFVHEILNARKFGQELQVLTIAGERTIEFQGRRVELDSGDQVRVFSERFGIWDFGDKIPHNAIAENVALGRFLRDDRRREVVVEELREIREKLSSIGFPTDSFIVGSRSSRMDGNWVLFDSRFGHTLEEVLERAKQRIASLEAQATTGDASPQERRSKSEAHLIRRAQSAQKAQHQEDHRFSVKTERKYSAKYFEHSLSLLNSIRRSDRLQQRKHERRIAGARLERRAQTEEWKQKQKDLRRAIRAEKQYDNTYVKHGVLVRKSSERVGLRRGRERIQDRRVSRVQSEKAIQKQAIRTQKRLARLVTRAGAMLFDEYADDRLLVIRSEVERSRSYFAFGKAALKSITIGDRRRVADAKRAQRENEQLEREKQRLEKVAQQRAAKEQADKDREQERQQELAKRQVATMQRVRQQEDARAKKLANRKKQASVSTSGREVLVLDRPCSVVDAAREYIFSANGTKPPDRQAIIDSGEEIGDMLAAIRDKVPASCLDRYLEVHVLTQIGTRQTTTHRPSFEERFKEARTARLRGEHTLAPKASPLPTRTSDSVSVKNKPRQVIVPTVGAATPSSKPPESRKKLQEPEQRKPVLQSRIYERSNLLKSTASAIDPEALKSHSPRISDETVEKRRLLVGLPEEECDVVGLIEKSDYRFIVNGRLIEFDPKDFMDMKALKLFWIVAYTALHAQLKVPESVLLKKDGVDFGPTLLKGAANRLHEKFEKARCGRLVSKDLLNGSVWFLADSVIFKLAADEAA